MLNVYFGEWGEGRLKRLPYLGYHILLMVLMFSVIFGIVLAVGASVNLLDTDLMSAQAFMFEKFGLLAIICTLLFLLSGMVAQVNILAKRVRDMGLPAFWTILGMIAVSMLLNILFPAQQMEVNTAVVSTAEGTSAALAANATEASIVVHLFDLAVFLCLILIPSDTFNKRG
ncbi:hypothetical protein ACM66Z_08700 [Sulfurovum sp. ST-21]|uniref:DUF805 domain-containing protein n=1 Tax=Sulfurovum indicum TaxID=2779528 RepID=A0A7M1S257_9BACT|nr:hypothetical protein [Sulfurovum indicum]QOR61507.1 hypothetical protein IMZ28_08690 [Sulfurovum indicum]